VPLTELYRGEHYELMNSTLPIGREQHYELMNSTLPIANSFSAPRQARAANAAHSESRRATNRESKAKSHALLIDKLKFTIAKLRHEPLARM